MNRVSCRIFLKPSHSPSLSWLNAMTDRSDDDSKRLNRPIMALSCGEQWGIRSEIGELDDYCSCAKTAVNYS